MAFRSKGGNESDGSRSNSEESNSDDEQRYVHWKRVRKNNLPDLVPISVSPDAASKNEGRKVNTVWADVYSEQELSRTVSGNISLNRNCGNRVSRGPESYSAGSKPFVSTREQLDKDLDAHTSSSTSKTRDDDGDLFNNVYVDAPEPLAPVDDRSTKRSRPDYDNRKRPYHHDDYRHHSGDRRFHARSNDRPMLFDVKFDVNDPVEKLAGRLAWALKESKRDLITRCFKRLGVDKCLELYHATELIEKGGGMLVVDGSRRRTAGGVFLHLLREDSNISDADKKEIFELEVENARKFASARRRNNRRKNFDELLAEAKSDIKAGKTLRDKKDVFLDEATAAKETEAFESMNDDDGEIVTEELDVCATMN